MTGRLLSLVLLCWSSAAWALDRPNILWLTAEDLSPRLGCYGDATVPTPNFDRLAEAGVTFTNAFAQMAFCTPSRCAMFTGLYPHHHNYLDWERPLDPSIRTVFDAFADALQADLAASHAPGVSAAIIILIVAVTGLLLNHTEDFQFDSEYIQTDWILDWYGIEAPHTMQTFLAGDRYITLMGEHLYLTGGI